MMLITNAAPNEVITVPSASVDRRVACSAIGTCGEVCENESDDCKGHTLMLINKSYVAAGTPTTPHEISCGRVEPQACHEQKFTLMRTSASAAG